MGISITKSSVVAAEGIVGTGAGQTDVRRIPENSSPKLISVPGDPPLAPDRRATIAVRAAPERDVSKTVVLGTRRMPALRASCP